MLLYTENVEMATAEIESLGGRVAIQSGDNLLIADMPADIAAKQDAFVHASAQIPTTASASTLNDAEAYEMYREDKLDPQPKVQKWTEKTAPKAFPRPNPLLADGPEAPTLKGKIAVAVLVVSGPGSLEVSEAEFTKINSEVLTGLKFWTDKAPPSAGLSFATYKGLAKITAPNPVSCSTKAACHDKFAIPAYKSYGYASTTQLAQRVKDVAGAVGGYVAIFSKYRQGHFAYAYFNGGPIYMQYSNDGWGPDQIDRVFAHETGHVFNAPDEYTNCRCSQNYGGGSCTAKNSNCKYCTSSQQNCIMDSNDINNICASTKKHVGWC